MHQESSKGKRWGVGSELHRTGWGDGAHAPRAAAGPLHLREFSGSASSSSRGAGRTLPPSTPSHLGPLGPAAGTWG